MIRRRRIHLLLLSVLAFAALGAAHPAGDPLGAFEWHLPAISAPTAWQSQRGAGVTVAVVDTGVDPTHPDLAGRLVPGIDLVDPGTPPDDPNGHGTLIAGVIAAAMDNGLGTIGVAPEARIMPVRVMQASGSGAPETVAAGVRWAVAHGADVINLSLTEQVFSARQARGLAGETLELAVAEADAAGVTVVAAAGNNGWEFTPYSEGSPALIVGATERSGSVWRCSNRDDRTLFAPGVEIVTTYLGSSYALATGTSFATPMVAASAAILRGLGLSNDAAQERILSTATFNGSVGRGNLNLGAALGYTTADGSPARLGPAADRPPGPAPGSLPLPDTLLPDVVPETTEACAGAAAAAVVSLAEEVSSSLRSVLLATAAMLLFGDLAVLAVYVSREPQGSGWSW